jgi:hypothetical protein
MLASMNPISQFDELLRAAAAQPSPQRLLFVFAGAELPADATPAQRASFEAGEGGALEPLACVDKRLDELSQFHALVVESRDACPPWRVAFIAALGGAGDAEPTDAQVDAALNGMVEKVRIGRLRGFLALDPEGHPVSFQ